MAGGINAKLPWLVSDIEYLRKFGTFAANSALSKAMNFAESIRLLSVKDPVALLGVLYVLIAVISLTLFNPEYQAPTNELANR